MAAFLIYRSASPQQHRLPYDVGAFLVNAADEAAARDTACALSGQFSGGAWVASDLPTWKVVKLTDADLPAPLSPIVFQGECITAGQPLRERWYPRAVPGPGGAKSARWV